MTSPSPAPASPQAAPSTEALLRVVVLREFCVSALAALRAAYVAVVVLALVIFAVSPDATSALIWLGIGWGTNYWVQASVHRILMQSHGDAPVPQAMAQLEWAMLVSGARWGAMTWLLSFDQSDFRLVVVFMVLSALTAVTINIVALSLRALSFYLCAFWGLVAVRFISMGNPVFLELGLGALALLAALLLYGHGLHQQRLTTLRTRLHNERLLDALTRSRHEEQRQRLELAKANAQLLDALSRVDKLAHYDELTAVFNRRSFIDRAHKEMERRTESSPLNCLVLCDLDHFKEINDNFGHGVGDETLKLAAAALSRAIREKDTLARYGGEEFVILLSQAGLQEAQRVTERMRQTLNDAQSLGLSAHLRLSASFGLTEMRDGESLDAAISRADKALYRAKHDGRNCVRVADTDGAIHPVSH